MIKYIGLLILIPTLAIAGAKTVGPTKGYTYQQKIQRGDIIEPKMTTCRLKKILKSRSGRQACIYEGGNKTYELMYEDNCPRQYKCRYNPNSEEPNIDNVMDSLNQIGK